MTEALSRAVVGVFFDRFVEAFSSFDGRKVGSLFSAQGVAVKRDNSLSGFCDQADVEAYYQNALDYHRNQGCTSARWFDLEVYEVGPLTTVASVTWDLLTAEGSLLSRWRQAYFLKRTDNGPKIFGSTFIAE